jgi:predicted DNA-binding ribbon-helix-helix protein
MTAAPLSHTSEVVAVPSDDYEEMKRVGARFEPEQRRLLDRLVEERDEWGNRSAALRGCVEEVADDRTVTDGGLNDRRHTPTGPVLEAVYEAALDAVDREFKLRDGLLSTVAREANNDTSTPISPNTDGIRRYLRRLQSKGYVFKTMTSNFQGDEATTYWRVKPPAAVPEKWTYNIENVEERQKKVEEQQYNRMVSTGAADD